MPVRLAEHRDAEAGRFEHAAQDRHREARVIDVGVAGDEDDVDGIPAAAAPSRPRVIGNAAIGEWSVVRDKDKRRRMNLCEMTGQERPSYVRNSALR